MWDVVHSDSTGVVGQRGAPGRAVFYASHTVVLDGSLFEKEQGGHTFSFEPHGAATRRHDAPCAGARTFALEPHRTGRPTRLARARRLPRPNLTRFRSTMDYACQDVSAAAEKRARWNDRWHPNTAGLMGDCCSLLVAALARAGRAGSHSSVPMPWTRCSYKMVDGAT
jgi:hypothetical protein